MTGQPLPTPLELSRLRLPQAEIRALIGRPTVVDGLTLDAATQLWIDLVLSLGLPPLQAQTPAEAREIYSIRTAALGGSPRVMARVEDRAIPGRGGPIPVRIYVPKESTAPLPGLVYYHGGGFVIGGLETHDRPCRILAEDAGCTVVSVDYRLAPEHKFPAAVDDAFDAYRWVSGHATSLGIDSKRIAVGGDSAGGGLATVVCRLARDNDDPRPFFQLMVYPVTDLTMSSRSYAVFGEGFLLTRRGMEWYRDHYLPSAEEQRNPLASPLLAEDLRGLPPALVVTAGFDPLKDEGRAYAERLRAAGVDVSEHSSESLIHGYLTHTGALPSAETEVARITALLRTRLGSGAPATASPELGTRPTTHAPTPPPAP